MAKNGPLQGMTKIFLLVSSTKTHDVKSQARVTNMNVHRPSVNSYKHTKVYPARKTKNLGNTENVSFTTNQLLTDLNVDDNGFMHTSTSECDSSIYSTDTSMVVEAGKRSFQHSQECKHPSLLGVQQPLLAEQENYTFSGNKNETRSFAGENTYTKSCSDDSLTQDSSYTGYQIQIPHNTVPCNVNHFKQTSVDNIPSQDVGITLQSWLADSKISFLGNKNKTESFDGEFTDANIRETLLYDNMFENCGDSMNVMDTAALEQDINQNCSRNCTDQPGQFQEYTCGLIHANAIQHGLFGFMPKGPLKIYDGNPVSWNSIPDIIKLTC